jgi:hypothetical protein
MGSRSYSQNHMDLRLQPPRFTSRHLLSQEKRTGLKREDVRLLIFNGRWPKDFIGKELAKAGFFFVAHSDKGQCAFCGDFSIDEHRRYFETYSFVQGVDSRKIPVKPFALTGGCDIC